MYFLSVHGKCKVKIDTKLKWCVTVSPKVVESALKYSSSSQGTLRVLEATPIEIFYQIPTIELHFVQLIYLLVTFVYILAC